MKISNRLLLKILLKILRKPKLGKTPPPKGIGTIEICPFKYGMSAAFSISADLELNWAWRFLNVNSMLQKGKQARTNMPLILKILDNYSIPITWATVGHLFLEKCERSKNGLPHPEMLRPSDHWWKWNGDWYYHDPCSNVDKDPLWYAPDLIDAIQNSKIRHEIGTHSFSHIDFSYVNCSQELARCEIEKCINVMENFKLIPRSFIFPFNRMSTQYYHIFSELNLTVFRHRDKKYDLSYPEHVEPGLWKICESSNLRCSKAYDFNQRLNIYIDKAIKNNSVLHLWFHPSDEKKLFKKEFVKILELMAQKRDLGEIWITTLDKLASYCEARRILKIKSEVNGKITKIFLQGNMEQRFEHPEITLKIELNKNRFSVFEGVNQKPLKLNTKNCFKTKDNRFLIVTTPIFSEILYIKYN